MLYSAGGEWKLFTEVKRLFRTLEQVWRQLHSTGEADFLCPRHKGQQWWTKRRLPSRWNHFFFNCFFQVRAHFIFFKCVLMFSGFRSVSFTLHTSDVLSTVKNILRSCSLPTDHVMQLKAPPNTSKRPPHQSRSPFYKPATKVDMSYTFSGFRDSEQELQQAKLKELTLRSGWSTSPTSESTHRHTHSLEIGECNHLNS